METYKRGQVISAVWRVFLRARHGPNEAPSVFRTRIKRLLELDRSKPLSKEHGPHAFTKDGYPGRGSDLPFTHFDGFMLAWGLYMLDAGLKQADVVHVLRHIRESAKYHYDYIMAGPKVGRGIYSAREFSDRPSYRSHGREFADLRVFVLLRRHEITDVYPLLGDHPETKPLFRQPVYCHGLDAFIEVMEEFESDYRHAIVFELSLLAWEVKTHLEEAPATRRGRP